MVELHTNHGIIKIELNAEKAPKSVENFLNYVKKGHYDNTVFHRVIDGFMIQGGGFEPGMKQKPTDAPIDNEANNGLKNEHGSVAMARTNDPHSATAQFFINVGDNEFLNHSRRRRKAGVMRCSARSWKASISSTRSARSRRARRAFIRTCRWMTSSSKRLSSPGNDRLDAQRD